jgi:phosphohistidine phosphatase
MEDWNELKPEGNRPELYRKLSSRFKQQSSVLIVGHEPYLTDMIGEMIFNGKSGTVVLRKAGLARTEASSSSSQKLHGQLKWLLTPRHMKNMVK